ncbi:MAG: glucoamylase family protein, partial [Polyangiaceae bacterium]
ATRDRYRHAVEDQAKRGRKDEVAVARLVVDHAKQAAAKAGGDPRATHVGFWLVDDGRALLEAEVGYRPKLLGRVRGLLQRRGAAFYLGSIAAGSVLAALFFTARTLGRAAPLSWLVLFLLALPVVSELVITAVNWLVTALMPPRLLPKLCLDDGVPAELRTMVVVPAFLSSEEGLRELSEELEVRSLSNPDEHVHFALLTDWPDADSAVRPGEAELLEKARLAIVELNRRFGRPDNDRYFLFHRRRVHDPAQGRWMGWERKRGKLEELNRLLRGEAERTTFELVTALPELLASVRYVITLDADTQLPRDIARRLVAAIAHPLNRAQLDESGRRVIRGYGVVQPRVGTTLASAGGSRFSRLSSGHAGIDPYTTAVSDVYQDLTGEGAYIGKAIYDVDAFRAALSGRVPDDRLLSHDLFEGIYARTALASDIELLDDQPSRYAAHAMRQHRWVRGDWQLASWLLPRVPTAAGKARNDVGAMGWWKLFDNLRRSVLPPLSVALLLFGWLAVPQTAAACTALVALVLATPLYGRLASTLVRPAPAWASGALFGDLRNNALQVLFNATVLLDQAALLVDAIARTFRRLISGKDLLEWVTASDAERTLAEAKNPLRRAFLCSVGAVVIAALVILRAPASLPWALPLLLLWALAPVVVAFASAPLPPRTRVVGEEDRVLLRRSARATWRFFETFVTDEDHWLPPDNYQEDPKGVIAHRTSPTNIGLYLLSTVAARDFGFVTIGDLCQRLEDTLDTIDGLERYEGHILNWYDTSTLAPLEPRYVSTVDNGNFVADLWTLRQAAQEIAAAPVIGVAVLDAALDAVALHREARAEPDLGTPSGDDGAQVAELMTALAAAREHPPADVGGWSALLSDLAARAESLAAPWRSEIKDAREPAGALVAWWAEAAALGLVRAAAELAAVAGAAGPVPVLAACDTDEARALSARLSAIGDRALRVADGMPFSLVYDRGRELFSIGYNASNGRLDASYYDLLASEARLASLLAIAKGEVPQRHWFRLGRALAPAAGGRALLSWSGSMFEYLMPVLLTRRYEQTLLDETCDGVVARQRDYAKERGVPWGISESAFNTLDLGLTYQYRAFGVPGLGLKPGLADELVVAPYATMLAAQVDVGAATRNLRALIKEGALGGYGFYESIDYTPAHVPPGRHGVVVKAYMAHHQGMSLVALDNVLHDDPMQRRFHADPRIKASELLLQERIPLGVPINPPRDAWRRGQRRAFARPRRRRSRRRPLGRGAARAFRPAASCRRWSPAGTACSPGRRSTWCGGATTPRSMAGLLCYLRDLDSGEVVGRPPADAQARRRLRGLVLRGPRVHLPARRRHRDGDRHRGLAGVPGGGAARGRPQPRHHPAAHRDHHLRRAGADGARRGRGPPGLRQPLRRDRGAPRARRGAGAPSAAQRQGRHPVGADLGRHAATSAS